MGKKVSSQEGFKVAPTVGKIAEGENSLLSLNNKIMAITDPNRTGEIFDPMWHLCLACANKRKLISKVNGDSNDFLRYATLGYVQRWQKQFLEDSRRTIQYVQNWIPYILGTIRFALISYNKEVFDYDFLPLPRLLDDQEDSMGAERDIEDPLATDPLVSVSIKALSNKQVLHSIITELPKELKPYALDILYYVRTSQLISKSARNFVIIGKAILSQLIEKFVY